MARDSPTWGAALLCCCPPPAGCSSWCPNGGPPLPSAASVGQQSGPGWGKGKEGALEGALWGCRGGSGSGLGRWERPPCSPPWGWLWPHGPIELRHSGGGCGAAVGPGGLRHRSHCFGGSVSVKGGEGEQSSHAGRAGAVSTLSTAGMGSGGGSEPPMGGVWEPSLLWFLQCPPTPPPQRFSVPIAVSFCIITTKRKKKTKKEKKNKKQKATKKNTPKKIPPPPKKKRKKKIQTTFFLFFFPFFCNGKELNL